MGPHDTHNEQRAAIVLAAGSGSRFGTALEFPKQFHDLCGEPILVRSIRAMLACTSIQTVACTVAADWAAYTRDLLETATLAARVMLIEGGATRQESAQRSLAALSGSTAPRFVLFHDAARPLVPPKTIKAALDAAESHGAAVVAAPTVDTIASTNAGFLDTVPDRSTLVNIQTPQAFRYDLIRDAHQRAIEDGICNASDDAALVLRLGGKVAVVPGPATNIKITSPADLELARLLIAGKKQ